MLSTCQVSGAFKARKLKGGRRQMSLHRKADIPVGVGCSVTRAQEDPAKGYWSTCEDLWHRFEEPEKRFRGKVRASLRKNFSEHAREGVSRSRCYWSPVGLGDCSLEPCGAQTEVIHLPSPDLHRAVPRNPWKWLLVFLRIKMTVDLSLGETFLDRT